MSPDSREKTVMAAHCSHCGGTCLFRVHVKDGVVTRIEGDDGKEPQYRGCARGRAYRQRVYAPDRLLYPMKRVGERGEGKFRRISWDEALDAVAGEITRVRDKYGPAAILLKRSAGDTTILQGAGAHARLLRMAGGCTEVRCLHSFEGGVFAQVATFGTVASINTRDDLLNSRLIILWGLNPADTLLWTNTAWYLVQAKESGTRIISVDPRYTNTAAQCASQWIPIRPGTDAAMLLAMAYTILAENRQDQKFLDKYTVGFEKFKDYITGAEDGIAKTPEWAEAITGVPASVIRDLAREYATTRPAALLAGVGPGRTAYGEQYHRAAGTLAAMTGNIGVGGGHSGVSCWTGMNALYPYMKLGRGIPMPPNPVEPRAPRNDFPSWGGFTMLRTGDIHQSRVADAILKGKSGGYPSDYKLLYIVNNNYPNQYPDVNKGVAALKSNMLEFIVVFEQYMTPAARFADILLPVNTCFERNDICVGPTVGFYGFMGKAVDSLGESKSHLEICIELAGRLGIPDYATKTEDEWLKQIAAGSPEITDYEAFKEAGGCKTERSEPFIAFQEQIEDPENHPFPTPSGKIEIYCQRLADMNDPLLPAIPRYIETWESRNDPLAARYPLQLITTHFLRRALSQYDNVPWLRELEPQAVLINTADARARGIKDGDMVSVFNDRGRILIRAKVTERIMTGVVDVPQGAWYSPDDKGVDRGGCANVLTRDEHSPGSAFVTNTALVQVEKASE